jgi:hypothetical protein
MTTHKVDDPFEINDVRLPTELKGISFSGFKKTEVRNQLLENMKKGKVEPACYWCAELVCAGHYMEIWESILFFMSKHIHLANPKMAIYLAMRFNVFKNIVSQGYYSSELQLRNNANIRKLFAEVICNLTMSNKKPGIEPLKINRVEEFDMTQMTERLKAPSVGYVEPFFQKDDPKELLIALNELGYHLSADSRNMNMACYWIEWMIEFDAVCKMRKEIIRCERRLYPVENKCQRDVIWLVWDAIVKESEKNPNPIVGKIITSLSELFCIKYTAGTSKKRRYLLYFAVATLTEPFQTNQEIVANKDVLQNVVSKINQLYRQIKKNEHSPNTEYLFAHVERENTLEKTIQKLEIMQHMDIV